jgi:hypothetical protein
MVAAYLRGLLKPELRHGIRSRLAENLIFEALEAENLACGMIESSKVTLALIPLMQKSSDIRATADRVARRLRRAADLRLLDVYKVKDQLAAKYRVKERAGDISMFQLFRVAEKGGIFNQFVEQSSAIKFKPIF